MSVFFPRILDFCVNDSQRQCLENFEACFKSGKTDWSLVWFHWFTGHAKFCWLQKPKKIQIISALTPAILGSFDITHQQCGTLMFSKLLAYINFEQEVDMSVIWDAMTLTWRHCNIIIQYHNSHCQLGKHWYKLVASMDPSETRPNIYVLDIGLRFTLRQSAMRICVKST